MDHNNYRHPNAVPIHTFFHLPPGFSKVQLDDAFNKLRTEYNNGRKEKLFKNLNNMFLIASCPYGTSQYYRTGDVELTLRSIHTKRQATVAKEQAKRKAAAAADKKLQDDAAEQMKKRIQTTAATHLIPLGSSNSRSQIDALNEKNEKLERDISETLRKRDTLISRLQSAESEIKGNEDQLNSLSSRNSEIEREINEMEQNTLELQKLLMGAYSTNETLNKEFTQVLNTNQSLITNLHSLKAEEGRLESESSQIQQKNEEQKELLKQARSQLRKLKADIKAQRSEYDKTREKLKEEIKEYEEIKSDRKSLSSLKSTMEKEINNKEKTTLELKRSLENACTNHSDMNSKVEMKLQSNASLQTQLDSIKAEELRLLSNITQVQQHIEKERESLKAARALSQNQVSELEAQVSDCNVARGKLEQRKEEQEQIKLELQSLLDSAISTNCNLRSNLAEETAATAKMSSELESYSNFKIKVESQVLEVGKEIEQLTDSLQRSQSIAEQLKTQLDDQRKNCCDLEQQQMEALAKAKRAEAEMEVVVQKLALERDNLIKKQVNINLEIGSMQDQLTKSSSSFKELELLVIEKEESITTLHRRLERMQVEIPELQERVQKEAQDSPLPSPIIEDFGENGGAVEYVDWRLVAVEESEAENDVKKDTNPVGHSNSMELHKNPVVNAPAHNQSKRGSKVPKTSKYDTPSGLYACNICGKTYTSYGACSNHRSICHPSRSKPTYSCEKCGKQLSRKDKLQKHLRTQHMSSTPTKTTSKRRSPNDF